MDIIFNSSFLKRDLADAISYEVREKEIVLFQSETKSNLTTLFVIDGTWESDERFIYIMFSTENGDVFFGEYTHGYYGNDIEPSFSINFYVFHKSEIFNVFPINMEIPYEDNGSISEWYMSNVDYIFLEYIQTNNHYLIKMSNYIESIFDFSFMV